MTIGKLLTGGQITLDDEARARHVHIVGQTGVGKSALLLNMIAADLAAGNGVAVLDPHGELAEAALGLVPPSRFHEVVYISPDLVRPIGFNPLHGVPLDRRAAATDEIASAFTSIWNWSPETAPRASFSTALSEARKKGLSLTLAHQYARQLPESLLSAVLGNTGTTICFRVGAEDAGLLAAHVGGWVADYELAPRVLKELPNYRSRGT